MFKMHRDRDKVYTCHICDYTTKVKKILDVHLVKHNSPSVLLSEETLSCLECGKNFQNRMILRRHKKEVHFGVEICCNLCDYKTKRRRNLVEHKNNCHSEDGLKRLDLKKNMENFQCCECGKQFAKMSSLSEHIDCVHKDIRRYQCDKCEKVFKRRRDLVEHMDSVHKEMSKYQCDQ